MIAQFGRQFLAGHQRFDDRFKFLQLLSLFRQQPGVPFYRTGPDDFPHQLPFFALAFGLLLFPAPMAAMKSSVLPCSPPPLCTSAMAARVSSFGTFTPGSALVSSNW